MARNPRDMNELEGTLLPVLATAVPVQNDTLPPHSVAEATLIPIPPPVSSTTTTATTAPAPVAPVLRTVSVTVKFLFDCFFVFISLFYF